MPTTDWTSTAVVIRVNGPEEGFPADISYDVEVNIPNGELLPVDGVQPLTRRRDQRRCMIEALPVGSIMLVASTADVLQFTAWEFEALEDCEETAPRPGMMIDPNTGLMVPIPTVGGVPTVNGTPTTGGSTPGGGADGAPAGGGGEF